MKNTILMEDEEKLHVMKRYYEDSSTYNYTTKIKLEFWTWLETQDPDYMDSVVIQCNINNIPISGVLLEQLAIASTKRLLREYSYGKRTKINQDLPYEEAYQHIFRLTQFCNKTREEASLLAAWFLYIYYPDHTKLASTLDQEYRVWKKKSEELIKYSISDRPDGWTEKEQEKFITYFPKYEDINKDLSGSRRGKLL